MMMHEASMPEGAEREREAEAERDTETESCKRTQKKVRLRQLNISASEGNDERPVSGQADLKVLPSLGNTRSPVGAGNGPARTQLQHEQEFHDDVSADLPLLNLDTGLPYGVSEDILEDTFPGGSAVLNDSLTGFEGRKKQAQGSFRVTRPWTRPTSFGGNGSRLHFAQRDSGSQGSRVDSPCTPLLQRESPCSVGLHQLHQLPKEDFWRANLEIEGRFADLESKCDARYESLLSELQHVSSLLRHIAADMQHSNATQALQSAAGAPQSGMRSTTLQSLHKDSAQEHAQPQHAQHEQQGAVVVWSLVPTQQSSMQSTLGTSVYSESTTSTHAHFLKHEIKHEIEDKATRDETATRDRATPDTTRPLSAVFSVVSASMLSRSAEHTGQGQPREQGQWGRTGTDAASLSHSRWHAVAAEQSSTNSAVDASSKVYEHAEPTEQHNALEPTEEHCECSPLAASCKVHETSYVSAGPHGLMYLKPTLKHASAEPLNGSAPRLARSIANVPQSNTSNTSNTGTRALASDVLRAAPATAATPRLLAPYLTTPRTSLDKRAQHWGTRDVLLTPAMPSTTPRTPAFVALSGPLSGLPATLKKTFQV
jgi:hypothetical protein